MAILTDEKPWDIKRLILSLGGENDENGFIKFEVFDDAHFSIYEGNGSQDPKWSYEGIDLEAAKRLRDFLIYALPYTLPEKL